MLSPRHEPPGLVIKVSVDGNKSTFHETAAVRIRDGSSKVFSFVIQRGGDLQSSNTTVRNLSGTKLSGFDFCGVSMAVSVFFVRLKVFFPSHGYARRWFDVEIPASSLRYDNADDWFSGSMRDVRTPDTSPRTSMKTLSVLDGVADLVVTYTATKRFSAAEGGDLANVAFDSFQLRLKNSETLAALLDQGGDKLNVMIDQEWIGRANRIATDEETRIYRWISANHSPGRAFPSARQIEEEREDIQKAKSVKNPLGQRSLSGRQRSATIESRTGAYIPDGVNYSNPVRKLPLDRATDSQPFDLVLFNHRYDPPRFVHLLIDPGQLALLAQQEAQAAAQQPLRKSPRWSARNILSPRAGKKRAPSVPVLELQRPGRLRGKYKRQVAKGVHLTLAYSVFEESKRIELDHIKVEASVLAGDELYFYPTFK